jgi:hypothetical protein
MTATMIVDDKVWYQAWLDTPIVMPRCSSAHEAMKTPGCAVKSRERVTEGDFKGFPKMTGKLVKYTDDLGERCIVRGHGDATSPKFVWYGTLREYLSIWECD